MTPIASLVSLHDGRPGLRSLLEVEVKVPGRDGTNGNNGTQKTNEAEVEDADEQEVSATHSTLAT